MRFVPGAGGVAIAQHVFPKGKVFEINQGRNHIEIGTDERFDIITQGVNVSDPAVIGLHFGKAAPVEGIRYAPILDPVGTQKLDIFQIANHPVRVGGSRIENPVGCEMIGP
ncbi:MAG: hypothetical protein BWY71_02385 [Planctomycetes bacterium ADurb.Bin412]|nr:MAG: hypothetical protein BWY71_02385 [Planctomycetes bacterium ADurb.Bin412]